MSSIVHRSVPTNLKWLPNCSHAHALFQDRFKDAQVGSRWFSTLYILSPNFHIWAQCPSSKHLGPVQELLKSMMIGKALLSGLWVPPEGCFTVRFTFAFLTLALVSLSVSLSFHHSHCDAALSLFASKWLLVSCYALSACAMWSRGSWLERSLVSAWCFCCFTLLLVWPGGFDVLPFISAAIPCRDDTMLSSLAWISHELAPVTLGSVVLFRKTSSARILIQA